MASSHDEPNQDPPSGGSSRQEETKPTEPRLCWRFEKGFCTHGVSCKFHHRYEEKSTLEHLAVMLDAQMATISVLNNQISQISQRSFDRGNPNSIISRLERIEQKMATPNQDRSRSTMRARSASVHRIYPKK